MNHKKEIRASGKLKAFGMVSFITAAISFSSAFAQDYNITFAILGNNDKPTEVNVENTTQGTDTTLASTDILNLVKDISTGTGNIIAPPGDLLQVYPNPVKENATIVFKNPVGGEVSAVLFNTAGAQVSNINTVLPQGEASYLISGLNTGSYVLQVQTANYQTSVVILSLIESKGTPGIELIGTKALPQLPAKTLGALKSAKSGGKTVQMQYNPGDVLNFTATIDTNIAKLNNYTATQDDEIEFSFTYTVTFKDFDNTVISTFDGEYGDTVTYPALPEGRIGYEVNGWNFLGATVPANDSLVITAQYNPVSYNITYQNVGTKNAVSNPATYTIETTDVILEAPTDSTGFTFGGWFTDPAFKDTASSPAIAQGSTGDITFYAKWGFIDSRDSIFYRTVAIGYQVWMAENLRYLPSVVGAATGSDTDPYFYVFDYNGTNVPVAKSKVNYDMYGVLYNWPAAKNACPSGWHLPSDYEWTQMENYLANNGYNYDGTTGGGRDKIAKAMAASSGWKSVSNTGVVGNTDYPEYRNKSGFTALPGGSRTYVGTFLYLKGSGIWWSANTTEFDDNGAYYRLLYYDYSSVRRNSDFKKSGFSVRCVKN